MLTRRLVADIIIINIREKIFLSTTFSEKITNNGIIDKLNSITCFNFLLQKKGSDFNLVKSVAKFTDKVLFISSECNTVIVENIQKIHIKYFSNAELIIINAARHGMYSGKPEVVLVLIREFLVNDLSENKTIIQECNRWIFLY